MHPEAAAAPLAPSVRTHMLGSGLTHVEEGVPADRLVVTPGELEERAAEAHAMTFHPTSELAGTCYCLNRHPSFSQPQNLP